MTQPFYPAMDFRVALPGLYRPHLVPHTHNAFVPRGGTGTANSFASLAKLGFVKDPDPPSPAPPVPLLSPTEEAGKFQAAAGPAAAAAPFPRAFTDPVSGCRILVDYRGRAACVLGDDRVLWVHAGHHALSPAWFDTAKQGNLVTRDQARRLFMFWWVLFGRDALCLRALDPAVRGPDMDAYHALVSQVWDDVHLLELTHQEDGPDLSSDEDNEEDDEYEGEDAAAPPSSKPKKRRRGW